MKMRFNVLIILFCLSASGVYAATPKEAFEANRKSVLSGHCLKADGVCFGIGKAMPRSEGSQGQIAAFDRAQLLAMANLLERKRVSGIVWPEAIDNQTKAILSAFVAHGVTAKATIKGAVTVFKGSGENDICITVVAVDECALVGIKSASLSDAKRILMNPYWLKRHFKKYKKELVDFYLTQKELPPSLKNTDFNVWDDSQINLFCGLPPPVLVTAPLSVTNALNQTKNPVEDEIEEIHPEFILPPYATGNENETIGL